MVNDTINRILYTVSELFEILSAAAFAFSLIPLKKAWGLGVLIAVLLLLLSASLKLYAGVRKERAEALHQTQSRAEMHVVTSHRLKTLETVGVGADIVGALRLRLRRKPLPTDEFIKWLEKTLGRERAQEKINDVLRYSRTSESVSEPLKQDPKEERTKEAPAMASPVV